MAETSAPIYDRLLAAEATERVDPRDSAAIASAVPEVPHTQHAASPVTVASNGASTGGEGHGHGQHGGGGGNSGPDAANDTQESDFARVEALLALRTRSLGTLQREFDRRDRLLREALERLPTSSHNELSTLRQRHDAAVARAVEAELARAELRFALDETRTQLTAAPSVGASAQTRTADTQVLYERVAELQDTAAMLQARLRSSEEERALAGQRTTELEQELVQAGERAELSLAQERAAHASTRARTGYHGTDVALDALRGECSGLRARWLETEDALRSALARYNEVFERFVEANSENADLAALAHARSIRVTELEQALLHEQRELRGLKTQVAAGLAANASLSDAHDSEREAWEKRLRELEARTPAAAAEPLGKFLATIGEPLRELDNALDELRPDPFVQGMSETLRSDALEDSAGDANLAEQLATSERRVAELENILLAHSRQLSTQTGGFAPIAATTAAIEAGGVRRTDPTRLANDLAAERAQRRKLAVTVRALQAASESGEAVGPWIEELVDILAETGSLPPKSAQLR